VICLSYRRILQIIDCCKYLSKQSEEWTSFSMVSVLTNVNFSTNHVSPKVRQKIEQVQQQGMYQEGWLRYPPFCVDVTSSWSKPRVAA